MSDRNRNQKSSSSGTAIFATAAAVGIGALAAIGGYMYGKHQGEEEAKQEESRARHSQTRSFAPQSYAAAATSGNHVVNDVQKPYEHECIICLRPFEEVKNNNEALHTTPCGHIFCQKCIRDALQEKEECPICRQPVEIGQTLRIFL